jgi:homoserine dehydrogenase
MLLGLSMLGFGNVGRAFARLLLSKREWLRRIADLDVEVRAIATRSRGSLMSDGALDLERALNLIETAGTLSGYGAESTDLSPIEIVEDCGADVMIELTSLNIDSGQPAIAHVRAAFDRGMHVVTANKGPVAFAYDELSALARAMGVQFRFEGTVMDGTPVLSLVERTLPGCEVLGIRGIVNSTSNFVLTEMSRGKGMEEAIEEARALRITEEDPSMDIDGWDAAAKITALANVLMGAHSNPRKVDRTGIRGIDPESLRSAASWGTRFKLIASAEKAGGNVRTAVKPEPVGPDSPFWSVDGTSSAITIRTDMLGELTVIERNPTIMQTAYAIFSDVLIVSETL